MKGKTMKMYEDFLKEASEALNNGWIDFSKVIDQELNVFETTDETGRSYSALDVCNLFDRIEDIRIDYDIFAARQHLEQMIEKYD